MIYLFPLYINIFLSIYIFLIFVLDHNMYFLYKNSYESKKCKIKGLNFFMVLFYFYVKTKICYGGMIFYVFKHFNTFRLNREILLQLLTSFILVFIKTFCDTKIIKIHFPAFVCFADTFLFFVHFHAFFLALF